MPFKRREPITAADRAYNTRNSLDVQKEWIEKILEAGTEKLTAWEIDFIESIEGQLNNGLGSLSEKQAEILERIYNKI